MRSHCSIGAGPGSKLAGRSKPSVEIGRMPAPFKPYAGQLTLYGKYGKRLPVPGIGWQVRSLRHLDDPHVQMLDEPPLRECGCRGCSNGDKADLGSGRGNTSEERPITR